MPVSGRRFTVEEAQAALVEVRPLAEELVERHRLLREAMQRQSELSLRIAGNGGGLPPQTLAEVQEAAAREASALSRCLERLNELGVEVKDVERGLLDFPALRGDEEVLLCWHVGEDEIGWWHGTDEGFAGRRPLE